MLDELNVRYEAALDKALVEAKKEGINLTPADFTFPDLDPTKDYVARKKQADFLMARIMTGRTVHF